MKINPDLIKDLNNAGALFVAAVGKEINRTAKQVYNVKRVTNG